ncbi:MAG: hypothetical protein U0Q18_29410 [Bryobacteraceae bacterium]
MLKQLGIPMMALAGILAFAQHQAKAAVRFGVTVGAPAYSYPAYPNYAPPAYYNAPAYAYPDTVYVRPYRDRDRVEDRWEHRRQEWREHDEHRDHERHEYRDRR